MMSKNRRFSLVLWAVVVATLLLLLVWAVMPRPLKLSGAQVRASPFSVEVVDLGVTRVKDLYTIGAPIAGRLERIDLRPGDRVASGQVVARLRAVPVAPLDGRATAVAVAGIDVAQSRLEEMRARNEGARIELDRAERLARQGYISGTLLDQARTTFQEAQARLGAARADLQQARAAAAQATAAPGAVVEVRAPVAGTVLKVATQSEAVLPAGAVMLEIGDVQKLEVAADFLSVDAQRIKQGARATFIVSGQSPVAARVLRVEPAGERKISALGVEEQRVKVILELNALPTGLGHGYQGDVRIESFHVPSALLLPVEALSRDGQGWAVMRVKNGQVERVSVTVGETNGIDRQILGGLSVGEWVVIAPRPDLRSGQKVKIVGRPDQ